MAQSVLEYILRSKKEGTAAKEASQDLEGLEKQAKSSGKAGELLGKGWGIAQGALIAGGAAAIAAVPALLDQGVAIDAAEKALIGYTGSAEEADAAIRAVAAAAGGSISKLEATQNASRLFAMGLAETTDEAAKLTEMAVTLGAAMGEDAGTAFENFSLMLANQSIPRLDTFGISGAAVRERMAELTEEIEGLDRQTAFMMATMEIGGDAMDDLAAAGFEATNSLDRLKTMGEDTKNQLAETVANGLMPMIDEGLRLKDTIDAQKDAVEQSSTSYDDYLDRFAELQAAHPVIYGNTQALTEAQWAQVESTAGLDEATREAAEAASDADLVFQNYTPTIDANAAAMDGAADSADGLKESNDNLSLSMQNVTSQTLAKQAIDALTVAYDSGTISQELYETATIDVMTSLGGFTDKQANASVSLQKLQKGFEDGEIEALDYYSAVLSLNQQVGALPTYKKFTYEIEVTGDAVPGTGKGKPAEDWYQAGGQFTVNGPPGIDSVPVSFMATRGEVVTVTPRGGITPGGSGGGLTINANGAQFYGIGGIQEFADELLPLLDNSARNQ